MSQEAQILWLGISVSAWVKLHRLQQGTHAMRMVPPQTLQPVKDTLDQLWVPRYHCRFHVPSVKVVPTLGPKETEVHCTNCRHHGTKAGAVRLHQGSTYPWTKVPFLLRYLSAKIRASYELPRWHLP